MWYTPNGRSINEEGIAPDVVVEYTVEEYQAGIDPQDVAAREILAGTYAFEETQSSQAQ